MPPPESAPDSPLTPYDALPYPGSAFPQTHPDRLAALATLFGMAPAPVEACRVLEIGCGNGSNLLPMAFALPGSTFTGIDLAVRPIEAGRRTAEALGLNNVTLRPLDLMNVPDAFGTFDYLIAHGVYSWVPPPVRDRLLGLCRALLAPNGVAYVSYNTLPGGYLRRIAREMMRFHVQNLDDPGKRTAQARALLGFLVDAQPDPDRFYATFLRKEFDRISGYPDAYLFHDDLAEVNAPCYFYQFAGHAARHGLQYLAEADFFEMQEAVFPAPAAERLRQLEDDVVLKEQYLDFIKGRMFRQTLLCHQAVNLDRTRPPGRLERFYVASPLRPVPGQDGPEAQTRFENDEGAVLDIDHPVAREALLVLGERWPAAVPFAGWLAEAVARAGPAAGSSDQNARVVEDLAWKLYGADLADVYLRPSPFVVRAGARPAASAWARYQLRQGLPVTTLLHTPRPLDEPRERAVLACLDGTRDRAGLLNELKDFAFSPDELEQVLTRLGRYALLVA